MLRQGFGHIINTASVGAFIPMPLTIPYSTTKHAVLGLSKSLRAAAACQGIRVSVLCPGVIRTPILSNSKFGKNLWNLTPQQSMDYWEKYKPMDPDDFAREALDAVAKNQDIIIIPASWKRYWQINGLFPSRLIKQTQEDYESQLKLIG
jgi:short-subunit dehydrogenase